MSNIAEMLLAGVPRHRHAYNLTIQPSDDGEYVRYFEVLAALTAAFDGVDERAGEVLEGVTDGWSVYEMPNLKNDANARFIAWCRNNVPALLAQNATLRAENARWRENSRDTFDAMCAMRNSINEHIPMPSLESDLLHGPENSVFCAAVAEAVVAEVARLRGIINRSEGMNGAKIKPLVWHNFDAWTHWAEGACGTYHVEERNGYWQVELRVGGLVHGVTETGDTTPEDLDDAKAAAQADYEARILAALAPTDAAQAQPAWLSNCVVCGRIVDTREKDEGGDGHGCEYPEGWTCSSDCAEKLHPDPEWMKEGLAAQARPRCPYGAAGYECCGGYCDMDDDQKGCDAVARHGVEATDATSPGVTAGADAAQAREAAARLRAYMDRRKRAHGFDQETVHTFDAGTDSEANLTVADLEAILALIEART